MILVLCVLFAFKRGRRSINPDRSMRMTSRCRRWPIVGGWSTEWTIVLNANNGRGLLVVVLKGSIHCCCCWWNERTINPERCRQSGSLVLVLLQSATDWTPQFHCWCSHHCYWWIHWCCCRCWCCWCCCCYQFRTMTNWSVVIDPRRSISSLPSSAKRKNSNSAPLKNWVDHALTPAL